MFDTVYNYATRNKEANESTLFATVNEEESMTQQSDADECDINLIMEKYKVTGQAPQVIQQGIYGDFTEVGDYRTAVERIRAANEAFQAIPAKLREKFDNDPAKFIDFATNPDNMDEMIKLGLAEKIEIKDNKQPAPPPAPEPEKKPA